jgi:hypothetical protein
VNPLEAIAAEPTLDELLRKTKMSRTPEDEALLIRRLREKRAALLAKKDAPDDDDSPSSE